MTTPYLETAKQIARRNDYICHSLPIGGSRAEFFRVFSHPVREIGWDEGDPVPNAWWSFACAFDGQNGTPAHKARVFALLLAHEMTKTGDIKL